MIQRGEFDVRPSHEVLQFSVTASPSLKLYAKNPLFLDTPK